ncbi:hypothetical protein RDI58_004542 [Solanum bulbocastanum]|uniref:Uncharacterized protein n=1 Tax=Solanum bulbocastanum TaxID=147425 RepID=A0AAN8YLR3_SOLBU
MHNFHCLSSTNVVHDFSVASKSSFSTGGIEVVDNKILMDLDQILMKMRLLLTFNLILINLEINTSQRTINNSRNH